jgi:hypothetical protein
MILEVFCTTETNLNFILFRIWSFFFHQKKGIFHWLQFKKLFVTENIENSQRIRHNVKQEIIPLKFFKF